MAWLGSNWIWLVLGIGVLALMISGRGGCGMGHGGHGHNHGKSEPEDRTWKTGAPLASTSMAKRPDEHVPSIANDARLTPSTNQRTLATEHASHDSRSSEAGPHRHHHGC